MEQVEDRDRLLGASNVSNRTLGEEVKGSGSLVLSWSFAHTLSGVRKKLVVRCVWETKECQHLDKLISHTFYVHLCLNIVLNIKL